MKKILINLFLSKIFFFLTTSSLILCLNLLPLTLQFLHSPPGRTFALNHNNAQDFFFYQSLMNEGANGKWLTSDPYTTEPHQPSIIFSYFLWLGKIANLLHLPYAYIYHALRIMLSIFFLSSVFFFLFSLKIPYPRLTFLFFLFASPLLHTINDNGKLRVVPFMYWWTGMDPIRRIAYLPHHMFGALGLIISLILLLKYQQKGTIKYIAWLLVLAFLLAFIHTPSLFILLIILPPTLLIYYFSIFISTKNLKILNFKNWNLSGVWNFKFGFSQSFGIPARIATQSVAGGLAYWIIGLLVLFFMVSQTNRGFPWSQYIDWEKRFQFPLDKELLPALGILTPLAFIGSLKALISKQFKWILITCWFVIPFLFIPLAPKLGLSNIRLIQGVPYLPLAILATLGLKTILDFTIFKKFGLLGYWVIGLLFLLISLPTLSWGLHDQIQEYWPVFGNVYFDNRLSFAFTFINQNFPPDSITLDTFYTGNYLSAFTHTVSYIGHSGYTYNIDQKQSLVNKFFESKMSDEEAKSFLTSTKAKVIFQGPEEKPLYSGQLYPSILKPIFDREVVTLYIPI